MNRPKSSPRLKGQKHSGANVIIPQILSTYNAESEKDFGAKSISKTAQMAKLWQFLQGHPRPTFSKKVQRGFKGNFSKIAQNVALDGKAQKNSDANNIILYLVCT